MPGSPLSAAEALRAGLLCGPVETATRKQKLRSLLPGRRGSRAGGEAGCSGLAQAWSLGRTLEPTPREVGLGGLRPKQPFPYPQARLQVSVGRQASAAYSLRGNEAAGVSPGMVPCRG